MTKVVFFQNTVAYGEWKHLKWPTLADVLTEFPSLCMPSTFVLTQLPALQHRYYSISSSAKMYPGQIHCTVAVVNFQTTGSFTPMK